MRSLFLVLALSLFGSLVGGCSDHPAPPTASDPNPQPQPQPEPQPGPPPAGLSANDTPSHAVSRLIGAYQEKDAGAYAGMLTGDFRFFFSASADPSLASQFPNGWTRKAETQSASHLFSGTSLPAAQTIVIQLANTSPVDDNTEGVVPETHKLLVTRVDGTIQAGSTTYSMTNNLDVFYFVRGDAAHGLNDSQPADDQHWYLYRWVDQTVLGGGAQAEDVTWGRVKGLYR